MFLLVFLSKRLIASDFFFVILKLVTTTNAMHLLQDKQNWKQNDFQKIYFTKTGNLICNMLKSEEEILQIFDSQLYIFTLLLVGIVSTTIGHLDKYFIG